MLDFKQLYTFIQVARLGSFVATAKAENVVPAIIGRRIDNLENQLGVKLFVRSTRMMKLTDEGVLFLEDVQRILDSLESAKERVGAGVAHVRGQLKITAPAGFGRRHVATLVPRFQSMYPSLSISLNLSDRIVDLRAEGYDCAIRVGDMPDSSLRAVKLAENKRMCVATPDYLRKYGRPVHPYELSKFDCLLLSSEASQNRGWAFRINDKTEYIRLKSYLDCSDGQVLYEWCLNGLGIAWRSAWEVQKDIAMGKLETVLDHFSAPPNGIYAVFSDYRHQTLKLKLWIEFIKNQYAQSGYWTGYSI